MQLSDDIYIIGKRCLQVDVMLQSFFNDKGEVRTFGAIAVIVCAGIFMFLDRISEQLFRPVDLHPYFR
ncbi:hypothetical protein D3C87_1600450 [compost metagenome]